MSPTAFSQIDWLNIFHILGGMLAATLWLWLLKEPPGKRIAEAIIAGLLVNALWEFFADYLHWLPFHAATPDPMDIVRGGIGALIPVGFFIWGWLSK